VKAKPAPKPVKPKAQVLKNKPKTASKKKVLVDHDENAEDSPVHHGGEGDVSDNDQFGASSNKLQAAAPAKKKKTASETYTKVVDSPTSLV
jgi:DNA topoisomerase-2